MIEKTIMIVVICMFIFFVSLAYEIGYIKGFKKCKSIEDDILTELSKKYKFVSKTEF